MLQKGSNYCGPGVTNANILQDLKKEENCVQTASSLRDESALAMLNIMVDEGGQRWWA